MERGGYFYFNEKSICDFKVNIYLAVLVSSTTSCKERLIVIQLPFVSWNKQIVNNLLIDISKIWYIKLNYVLIKPASVINPLFPNYLEWPCAQNHSCEVTLSYTKWMRVKNMIWQRIENSKSEQPVAWLSSNIRVNLGDGGNIIYIHIFIHRWLASNSQSSFWAILNL